MIKKNLLLVLVLLPPSLLFGQKISIGTEVGFMSSINTDYQLTDLGNRRNTYFAGLNIGLMVNDRWSLTSGIQYLRHGYKHETCYIFPQGVKNQLSGKIDYLAIPLYANIYFGKSRRVLGSFGFFGAYNIKAVQDYPEPIGGCEIYYIKDMTASTSKFSIGGIVGLGYKMLDTDNFEIISSIKYYEGFSNTFQNPYPDIDFNLNRKYSAAMITISFNYKI